MAEDPTSASEALPVAALSTIAAPPAGADTGDEDPVTRGDVGHRRADRLDGADGLVTEYPSFGHLGNVPLQDVEVGATDGRAVDPHDGIGAVLDLGMGTSCHSLLPGPL